MKEGVTDSALCALALAGCGAQLTFLTLSGIDNGFFFVGVHGNGLVMAECYVLPMWECWMQV